MRECFMKGFGKCSAGLSREHYISRTVLEALGRHGGVTIGGLPWQPPNTLQEFGIQSLVAKILCDKHNSGLTEHDAVAGTAFRMLDAVDKDPASLVPLTAVGGPHFERWFLKIVCGLSAAGAFRDNIVWDEWKSLLYGGQWPDGWGMYVPVLQGAYVLAKELSIATRKHPTTGKILAVSYRVAGVHFHLLLGKPDDPAAWGHHRPRGIIFDTPSGERRLEFRWPHRTEQAVIYTKVGASGQAPPQWAAWNGP